jgi:hypothetical protein
VLITSVNYIPSIKTTLISSRELAKKGWEITFKDTTAIISHNIAKLKVVANWVFNAYYIDIRINYNLLGTDSLDFDYPDSETSPHLTNTSPSDYTSSSTNDKDSDEVDELLSPNTRTIPVIEIPSHTPSTSQQDNNPEPDSEEDTIIVKPRYNRNSDRLQAKEPMHKGLSIYNLASIAYLDSLNKGDSNKLYSTITLEELSDELSLNRPNSPEVKSVPTLLNLEARGLNNTSNGNLHTIFKEPKSYKEAINSMYKDQWLEFMKIEYKSLNKNKT